MLHQILNFLSPILELLVTPLAIMLSGAIGFYASERSTIKQSEAKENEYKEEASLVKSLLKDEIQMRWKNTIKKPLDGIGLKPDLMSRLKQFSEAQFDRRDLYVISSISLKFHVYFFFRDKSLISEIVHAHVLYQDLISYHVTVLKYIEGASIISELFEKEPKLAKLADELPARIEELDVRLEAILEKI